MNAAWLVPALVALPLLSQGLAPEDLRVMELFKAKNWTGLADHFEALGPKDRGRHLVTWMVALHRANRHDRTLEVCDAVLSQLQNPKDPQVLAAYEFKARSMSAKGQSAEAAKAWEAIGSLPGQESHLDNAVVEARNASDWATMARVARLRGERSPGLKPLADGWLGEALARQDQFLEAEGVLRAALAALPKQPHAWSNLARCLNNKKAWPEALEACDKALALDPKLVEARYNRGRACFELARYQEARDDFQAALGLLPGDPVLLANLKQAQRYLDVTTKPKKNKK